MIWKKIKSAVSWVRGMISSAIRWLAKKCFLWNDDVVESTSAHEAKVAASSSHISTKLKKALSLNPKQGYKTENSPIKNIATLCDYSIQRLSDQGLQNELKETDKQKLNNYLEILKKIKEDENIDGFEKWFEEVKKIFAFNQLDYGNSLNQALFAIFSSWEQNKYNIQKEINLAVSNEISNVMDKYAEAGDFKQESSQALKRLSAVQDIRHCIQDFFTAITEEDYENYMRKRFGYTHELPDDDAFLNLSPADRRAHENEILERNLIALACSDNPEDLRYLRYALREELLQKINKYFDFAGDSVARKELLIKLLIRVLLEAVSTNHIKSCEMILKSIYKCDITAMKDVYSDVFSRTITDNNFIMFKWIFDQEEADFLYSKSWLLGCDGMQMTPEKYIEFKTSVCYVNSVNPFLVFFNQNKQNKQIQQSHNSSSASSMKLSS